VGSGVLDAPTMLLVAVGLVVRTLIVAGVVRFAVTERQVTVITVAYILFYPLDYYFVTREFLGATVHLVFFVAVVKLLTARSERDYFYLKVIAFLELLAASLLSANLTFFLFLAGFLLFGVATFTSGEIRRGAMRPGVLVRGQPALPARLGSLTAFTALGILILTACLFFLLPRTARAAFRRLAPLQQHLTGFSKEVTLGQLGELKQQNTTVMHVKFAGDQRRKDRLKWRGTALATFDGRKWSAGPWHDTVVRVEGRQVRINPEIDRSSYAEFTSYQVQLNPVGTDYLFFAGTPQSILLPAAVVLRTPVGGYHLGININDPFRYSVFSYLGEPGPDELRQRGLPRPVPLDAEERSVYLGLPKLDPRMGQLAHDVMWRVEGGEYARAAALERYLRTNYGYTLELLSASVEDPLAHFLFVRRKGHCEYFASAMAVLLRTQGIPSRLVTGFQSGVYNPISGWHVIRAADAHSWVEAWFPDQGWVTFDPTPADPNAARNQLLSRLALYTDAAETFWQDWVLNYDIDRQFTLLSRVEESRRRINGNWLRDLQDNAGVWFENLWKKVKEFGLLLVSIAALLMALWLAGPRLVRAIRAHWQARRVLQGKANAADATLLYLQMLDLLRRRGIEKPAWVTPAEFVRQLPASPAAPLVDNLTRVYHDVRFGGHREEAPRMVELLAELEQALETTAR
jgi:transglutaminase-like putative cysteine protease